MTLLWFSPSSGIEGWAIRTATWSPYAHVGFYLDDGRVLDATPAGAGPGRRGVQVRQPRTPPVGRVFAADVPTAAAERALEYARTQIGKPYDYGAVIGIGLHRDWRCDDKWFCAEIVIAAFEKAVFPLLHTEHIGRVTPADVLLSPYLRPL